MGRSVVITTPFPTPEEIAADLGISGRRLKFLRDLVENGAEGKARARRNGSTVTSTKKAAKKASAGRTRAKR